MRSFRIPTGAAILFCNAILGLLHPWEPLTVLAQTSGGDDWSAIELELIKRWSVKDFLVDTHGESKPIDNEVLNLTLRGIVRDGAGDPVAGATVQTLPAPGEYKASTTTQGSGAFLLRTRHDTYFGVPLLITNREENLVKYFYNYRTTDLKPFEIVLEPWQTTIVTVIDLEKRALEGVEVFASGWPTMLTTAKTDSNGQAVIRLPSECATVIGAVKPGVGYDYVEAFDSVLENMGKRFPKRVYLTLVPAEPIDIQLVDPKGAPV